MKNETTISSTRYFRTITLSLVIVMSTGLIAKAQMARASSNQHPVTYNTLRIDNLEIFYREAGDPAKPTILLLHGFPTSSHMFRNLIPLLARLRCAHRLPACG